MNVDIGAVSRLLMHNILSNENEQGRVVTRLLSIIQISGQSIKPAKERLHFISMILIWSDSCVKSLACSFSTEVSMRKVFSQKVDCFAKKDIDHISMKESCHDSICICIFGAKQYPFEIIICGGWSIYYKRQISILADIGCTACLIHILSNIAFLTYLTFLFLGLS